MAVKLNEKNIATQSFKYILSKIPNDKEILKINYQLLITLNKFDEALNYIDKLLKIEKDNFKAIKDKAFVFYNYLLRIVVSFSPFFNVIVGMYFITPFTFCSKSVPHVIHL